MLKVLIADDRASVCDGLKKLVPWNQLGAEIVGDARNGQEAFDIACKQHPDVIITDIRMPIMDGLSLIREIHAIMPDTVIIVLSAYDDFSYAQSALRFGVTEYILKPIDRIKIDQLTDKMSEIESKIRYRNSFYNLIYGSDMHRKVDSLLRNGDREDVLDFLEHALANSDAGSFGLAKELCLKLISVLFEAIEESDFNPQLFSVSKEESLKEFIQIKTKDELRRYVERLYIGSIEIIQNKKNLHRDTTIELLRKYIQQNYMDPNLSVSSIANRVGLSPNYTSILFRQMTGENMTTYITTLRITKARELFRDPSLTINGIAKLVGYNDPHYFARVFKTLEGLTPSQYRNLVDSNHW